MTTIDSSVKRLAEEVLGSIPAVDTQAVKDILANQLADLNKKIIVLDDDPTVYKRFMEFLFIRIGP